MKAVRYGFLVLVAVVAVAGMSGTAYAFHSGGVAECGGCHSMHSPAPGGSYLLIGTDQSSTCLSCHEASPGSYHISTPETTLAPGVPPTQMTPGGDFAWLKKTYTFVVRGNTVTEEGETHGHNIIANDFNFVQASEAAAPGGTFPTSQLACNSCHDPHGQYRRLANGTISKTGGPIYSSGSYGAQPTATEAVGVYRLLAGAGYTKDGVTFNGVPAAVVPSTYNRAETVTQTRAAYGVATTGGQITWGNWCGTCHPGMHSSGNYVHPIDEGLGSTIASIYNNYVKTGDNTGVFTADPGGPYSSLTPFAENTDDYTVLAAHAKNDNSYLTGPGSTDQVMCLSCHRAHASGWEFGLRWNMEGEFMTYNGLYPGTDNGAPVQFARGRLAVETARAYYDRPVTAFATYQRVLCNKCHNKD